MAVHGKAIIDVCLKLFELRFKSDYEAILSGKTYPYSYFSEWCGRIASGNPHGYADLETSRALIKIGVNK